MRDTIKCTDILYNLVAMVTSLQEKFNVTDRRDRNFGVDFLFLSFDFFLKG